MLLTTYLVWESEKYIRAVYAGILVIFQVSELILFLTRSNKNLERFFESVYADDFMIQMNDPGKNKSLRNLHKTVNRIKEKLKKLRTENLAQLYFIEALVKHARVGLLALDHSNRIYFVNQAFTQLLGYPRMKTGDLITESLASFWNEIRSLKHNDKTSFEWIQNDKFATLSCILSEFSIEGNTYRLYALQNIQSEIEETEISAWKKLMRILTHEIMNSASPIFSLSSSLNEILTDESMETDAKEQKLKTGLHTIADRSSGLMKFVEAYQQLTRIPDPVCEPQDMREILQHITDLFEPELNAKNIRLNTIVRPNVKPWFIDKYLFQQVLINVVKNAIEALEDFDNGEITISLMRNTEENFIKIQDNGKGIPNDKMDKIFIPFFSTKPNGTGIGLALSRQIIKLHNGQMNVLSKEQEGTTIIISIPVSIECLEKASS